MKIYEIGTGYTPIPAQVAAATESVVEEITKVLLDKKEDVEIIDISAEKRADSNLPIKEVKVPSFFSKSDVSLGVVHKLKRVVYSVCLAFYLKKILKSQENIVLHFHNQYNLFFFLKLVPRKLRNKATIAYTNHNGLWSRPWEEVRDRLHKRYFQEIEAMKNADLVFVLNSNSKANVEKYLNVPSHKVIKINNGVNTDIYTPLSKKEKSEIKQRYGLGEKKIILQVGSVYENKGQDRSIKLLEPLLKKERDLVFAFAGGIVSQEYFETVKNTAKELNVEDKVVYLGEVSPGKEMNELYNLADATIFVSKYESFGLVCIESMAAGVPVILCSESLATFGEGSIVSSNENFEKDLEDIIFSDDESYNLICEAARNNAICNYTWEIIAENYLKSFYKQ